MRSPAPVLRRLVLLATLATGGAFADAGTLSLPAELKADHYTDAATLKHLQKGAPVEVLERRAGWIRVRTGGATGWLRAAALGQAGATAAPSSPLLELQSGRAGKDNLLATTGVRGFRKPVSHQTHALIMAIGAYRNGIPNLTGVKYDAETARQIALRMGVPAENMQVLQDGDLTLDGMRMAFDRLEASLADGDQVFLYYSGHGGRQKVTEEDGAERCAESLVTVDGYGFIDSEMERRLKQLSRKAQKVIVFLDACHSGGVTTRAVTAGTPAYTPKYWVGKGSADTCDKPTNVVTRGITLGAKSPGSGAANFVYVAASRDDEISFDQPGKGGVASGAWLECMAGAAKDLDGSGGLSAEEIRACAQGRIDSQLGQSKSYLPHHVTLTGNSAMVLSYAAKDSAAGTPLPAPALPAPVTTEPPKPVAEAPSRPAALPPSPSAAAKPPVLLALTPRPAATLADIYNNRDDRRLVTLTSGRPRVRIGKDTVNFDLTSREPGYAYVVMVGSDGETFDVLFPNKLDPDNRIRAGETLHLPASQWELTANGPAGKDTLLAIVSDGPRDFAKAGAQASGPFSSMEAAAAKDIQLVSGTSAAASGAECAGATATRNLSIQKRCSGAYGAALLTIEEVR